MEDLETFFKKAVDNGTEGGLSVFDHIVDAWRAREKENVHPLSPLLLVAQIWPFILLTNNSHRCRPSPVPDDWPTVRVPRIRPGLELLSCANR